MWKCKACSESHEESFDSCWRCGGTRSGATARRQPAEDSEPGTPEESDTLERFLIQGISDELVVYVDHLTITPKGLSGLLLKGVKGTKSIPFGSITALQHKEAGLLFNGYLQFTIPGGNESRRGINDALHDENSFAFRIGANEEVLEAKAFIADRIGTGRRKPESGGSRSLGDELRRLGDLMKEGLLTEEEFRLAKQKLLK